MKKTSSVVVLALAFAVGPLVGPVAPASADTPRCATFREFRQVERGMRKARVRRILDIPGQFAGGFAGGYNRYYGSCEAVRIGGGDGGATISYDGRSNRVIEKRWVGYR